MLDESRVGELDATPASEKMDGGEVSLKERLQSLAQEKEVSQAKEPEPVQAKEPQIDYKAELEKAKSRLEREKSTRQYERDARKRAEQKVRELENNDDSSGETETPDEDLIERRINERFESLQRDQQSNFINRTLKEMTDDESERELIKLNYENKIKPSGFDPESIENDLRDAYIMANRPRFEATIQEKVTAKVKKDVATTHALKSSANSGGSVGREPPETQSTILSAEEERFLKAMGKGAQERYLKKVKRS